MAQPSENPQAKILEQDVQPHIDRLEILKLDPEKMTPTDYKRVYEQLQKDVPVLVDWYKKLKQDYNKSTSRNETLAEKFNALGKRIKTIRDDFTKAPKPEIQKQESTSKLTEKRAIEQGKIDVLFQDELDITADQNPTKLGHMCKDFVAWGGEDVVLDLRAKIKTYREGKNPSRAKVQQFIDTAKAYIHQMVMNDRGPLYNSYDTEKLKGLTFENMNQIANNIAIKIEDSLLGRNGEKTPNYGHWGIQAIFERTGKATETINAENFIQIRDDKIDSAKGTNDAENYKAYVNRTWALTIAMAHNGKNDNWNKYLSKEAVQNLKTMGQWILEYKEWKKLNP